MAGPLTGFRVVEMEAIGPVPLAAMLMAEMGADIVRLSRQAGAAGPGEWLSLRSRDYVAVDLKNAAAREGALALIGAADAVLEGFRPGVMERLGLGPDVCLARNPKLVFGRMTGWGQSGPLALRAGHDLNYISLSGALHAMGAPPAVPLNLVGDYGGGALYLVAGVLAALLHAGRTGQGQVVDAAMLDGTASLMSLFFGLLQAGTWEDKPDANLLDGHAPFYRCYECADGRYVAVGALEPQFFAQLLAGLGISADKYSQYDRSCWGAMAAEFAALFAGRARDAWAALFAPTDACVTPVLAMAEAPLHAQAVARGTFDVARGPGAQPAPAPRFSATPGEIRAGAVLSLAQAQARWGIG